MIDLFEHNKVAYESAIEMLSESGKAAIIHPTGTGKSFIGFKLCEDNPDKVICWLSPSSYIFKTQLENLAKVSNGYTPNNIKFFTYAKLLNLSDEELCAIRPDYIVLDEFHRCGAYEWGKGVKTLLELYEGVPILGMSATNVRYLDNRRDMADELFEGNIASEMTLGEAIVRGILTAPKYVISVYSYQKDLEKYRKRIDNAKNEAVKDAANRYLEALRRALEKADGLDDVFFKHMSDKTGKYIVFCADFEHMKEMMANSAKWFAKVDDAPKIYSVYSADPLASRAFLDFKADNDNTHLRLLYCIDALNEGIHLSDISGVILVRPTISPIVYKQQIGRALAANQSKSPIIFDIVNNFENLHSVSAVEEEMKVAINYYRYHDGDDKIVRDKFKIIDEVRDCKRLFDELNDTLSASWDMMYNLAKSYYEEHGDLVPMNNYKTAEGYSLGAWINTQRMIRRGSAKGYLSEKQIERLDAIGMRWETKRDCTWDRNYAELVKYYEQYGNIDVQYDYKTENGFALGNWIIDLRAAYNAGIKRSVLLPERVESLNSLGMIWSKADYIRENNYRALVKYHKEHGNAKVPKNYKTEDGIALGSWINNIKANYRTSRGKSLTATQKERLEMLGVELTYEDASEKRWNENYAKAVKYYREYGDLCVPYEYVSEDGFALGTWISRLRVANRRKTHIALTETRKKQLDEIGMVWDYADEASWDKYYSELKKYYEEYGNIDISAKTRYHDINLGTWLMGKREQYKKGSLSESRKKALDELGMDWLTPRERQWEDNFELAESYYKRHGNLNVPATMRTLYVWLNCQRKKQSEGELSKERYEKLSSVGMNWEKDDTRQRFAAQSSKPDGRFEKTVGGEATIRSPL